MYQAIIIGGGPAGLMAANVLEKAEINYCLLEKNEKCGKKLLITGGKRCNVTNHLPLPKFIDTMTFSHKRFLYASLTRFGPEQVLQFFSDHHLEFILENNFKYFPETEKSSSVLDAFMQDIDPKRIFYQMSVKKIIPSQKGYKLETKDQTFETEAVIVATGSNSYPSTGSSGDGLVFAKHLNIPYVEFIPAETSVYSVYVREHLKALRGVSLSNIEVTVPGVKISHKGDLLFTHVGLSGPVIMHLSEFIYESISNLQDGRVQMNLVGMHTDQLFNYFLENNTSTPFRILEPFINKKLLDIILTPYAFEFKKISEISHKTLRTLARHMTAYEIPVDRVETIEKAYVNKGGIHTSALYPKTFEVRTKPNLYFVGEITDLHGPIGGYNITIAMSSGFAAAQDIVDKKTSQ